MRKINRKLQISTSGFGCQLITQCIRSWQIYTEEQSRGVLIKQTSKFASVNLHSSSTGTYLTFPMASVWCCVQICSLLTQCCLSLASVAKKTKKQKQKTNEWAKPCNHHTTGTLLSIDPCALLHHHQQWVMENIQINIKWTWWMVMTVKGGKVKR